MWDILYIIIIIVYIWKRDSLSSLLRGKYLKNSTSAKSQILNGQTYMEWDEFRFLMSVWSSSNNEWMESIDYQLSTIKLVGLFSSSPLLFSWREFPHLFLHRITSYRIIIHHISSYDEIASHFIFIFIKEWNELKGKYVSNWKFCKRHKSLIIFFFLLILVLLRSCHTSEGMMRRGFFNKELLHIKNHLKKLGL